MSLKFNLVNIRKKGLITLVYKNYVSSMDSNKYIQMQTDINNFIYAIIFICTKMTKQLKLWRLGSISATMCNLSIKNILKSEQQKNQILFKVFKTHLSV